VLGGWLVDIAGWRSIFLINLPIAGVALWLAARHVGESRDASIDGSLDGGGALLATIGLGALTWGRSCRMRGLSISARSSRWRRAPPCWRPSSSSNAGAVFAP
jgi:MFS family permease